MSWVRRETDDVEVVKASEEVDLCLAASFVSFLDDLEGDVVDGRARGHPSRESERLEERLQKVSLKLTWLIFLCNRKLTTVTSWP